MNWKFWQTKEEPLVFPSGMSKLERAMLDDLMEGPEGWALRIWKDGMIKADSRGVSVISSDSATPEGICTAFCGPYHFSPTFAAAWHRFVKERLAEQNRVSNAADMDRTARALEQVFLSN